MQTCLVWALLDRFVCCIHRLKNAFLPKCMDKRSTSISKVTMYKRCKYLAICQIMISLSSPPVARYLPLQDHRTQFTQAGKNNYCIVLHDGNVENKLLKCMLLFCNNFLNLTNDFLMTKKQTNNRLTNTNTQT